MFPRLLAPLLAPLQALLLLGLLSLLAAPVLAHPGWGMERLPDGRVVFADIFHSTIWVIDADLDPASLTRLVDEPLHVHQLALTHDGALLAEEHDHRHGRPFLTLRRITSEDEMITLFGPVRDEREIPWHLKGAHGRFYGPRHFNPDGDPPRLYRWSSDGSTRVPLAGGARGVVDGTGAAAGFRSLGSIAWAADSTILVGDRGAVRQVSLDGTVTTLAADNALLAPGDEPFFRDHNRPYLYGLRSLPGGTVVVANFALGCLVQIGPPPPNSIPAPLSEVGTPQRSVIELHRSAEPWSVVNALPWGDGWLLLEAPSLHSTGLGGMRLLLLMGDGEIVEVVKTGV